MSTTIALPVAELKPALIGLGKVVSKRTTLPVLNHIKIERTKEGWIALTGTDLDSFVTVRMEQPANGEPASVLIPMEDLQSVVKTCGKGDTISIWTGEKLSGASEIRYPIGQQEMTTKVTTLPVDEFPEIPRFKGDSIPIPDALRSSLHEALECASVDETRMILNGAFIDVSDKKCHHVVGTDGGHLYASNSFSLPLDQSVIIPTHRFLGWKEFSNDGEWQLKLGTKPDKDTPAPLQISSRRWRFITRQHEGNYPNWRQVIPKEFTITVEIDPDAAEDIIKTVERMPNHDQMNHTLGIEIAKPGINLLCKSAGDEPWTRVPVKGVTVQGKDLTIYLNRHRFIKALKFGLLRMDIIDPMSPIKFSNSGRQLIVMPLRGQEGTVVTSKPDPAPEQRSEPIPPPEGEADQTANSPTPESSPGSATDTPTTSPATIVSNGTTSSSIETAITQIESIKGSYRDAIKGLNELADTLKQAARDQKTADREMQSVRSTVEKLQKLRL